MRNSWGSYWGEMGFARIMMHKVSTLPHSQSIMLPHFQTIMLSHSQSIMLPHSQSIMLVWNHLMCAYFHSLNTHTHTHTHTQDNLGLETDCDWGVPLLNPPSADAPPPTPTPSHKVPRGTYYDYKHPCVQKSKVKQPSARSTFHFIFGSCDLFLNCLMPLNKLFKFATTNDCMFDR